MEPKEIIEKAKKQLADLTGFENPAGVGLRKEEEDFVVTVEIIEKKAIPDGMNVLGVYDVRLNTNGDLQAYEKISMRKKMDVSSFEMREEET